MAFFIDMGQSPRSRLAEQIGLGAGKFLERRSQEQQARKQQSALASMLFGENANEYAQLPVEQQFQLAKIQSEQQKSISDLLNQARKEQRAEEESGILADIAEGKEISPEVRRKLSPQNQLAAMRFTNKAPAGGLSGQPVPQEISQKIPQILNENRDASADELALAFDQANVPRAYSNSYIESRRRQDEAQAKSLTEKGKSSKKERLDIHKSWDKYETDLRENSERAQKQMSAIADIEDSIKKGAASPFGLVNWARGFGKLGEKLSDAFLSAAQGKMGAALPNLIEGFRELFGTRITDADLKILESKLPSFGKSKEANEAILNVLKKYARQPIEKYKAAQSIKKKNKGFRPLDYDAQIEKRLSKSNEGEFVLLRDPEGILRKVPKHIADQIQGNQ